jgi:hypothetical protein
VAEWEDLAKDDKQTSRCRHFFQTVKQIRAFAGQVGATIFCIAATVDQKRLFNVFDFQTGLADLMVR